MSGQRTQDFPVKNTFIHFDIKDDNGLVVNRGDDGAESVDSENRLLYWLPSLSSSSSSRQRAASVDAGSSSSETGKDGRRSKTDHGTLKNLHDQAAAWKEQRMLQKVQDSSSSSQPLLPDRGEQAKEALQPGSSSAAGSKGPPPPPDPPALSAWRPGLAEIFSGIWQGSLPLSGAAAAAEPEEDPEIAEILAQIPRDEAGRLTSMGSVGHEDGDCTPCPFWFKGVCLRSLACRHCHFMHEGQRPRRLRPSKQGRQRLKKRMEENNPEQCSPMALAAKLQAAAEKAGLEVATPVPPGEQAKEQPAAQKPKKIQMSL